MLLPFKLGAGKQKLTADGLKPVEDVEPTAKPGASTVGNLPKPAEAAPETADATTGATTGATVGAASILDSAQQAAGNVADAVTGAAGSAANAVGSAVGTAVDAVSNAAGNVKDTLTGAAGSAKDTVQGVVVSLQDRLAALTAGGVDTNIDEVGGWLGQAPVRPSARAAGTLHAWGLGPAAGCDLWFFPRQA